MMVIGRNQLLKMRLMTTYITELHGLLVVEGQASYGRKVVLC